MRVRLLSLLAFSGLAVVYGCATLSSQPAPNELVDGARCTVRVWDRSNPDDASNRVDYWGTVASANAEKIVLVEADTETIAGKPLLEDPKQLPPAIWVRRMRERGKGKYTLRRDQILSIDVLDARRLGEVLGSYTKGTRCNIRTCDTSNPHDPAGFRDVWGTIARTTQGGIELKEAREEAAVISPPPSSIRLVTDEVREAHAKNGGAGNFKIAAERIISIEWLEGPRPKTHASSVTWAKESLF